MNKITKLKGGSLNLTTLHETDNAQFIRKAIDRSQDREYGFVRWQSQLKKLQRLYFKNQDLFPKVLNVGTADNTAYFDLEYLKEYKDIKTIFSTTSLTSDEIKNINNKLWEAFDKLHIKKHDSVLNLPSLYYFEEVDQKINDAKKISKEFNLFVDDYNYYEYNGSKIPNLNIRLIQLKTLFDNFVLETEEEIHGNPTLENILYSLKDNRIIFIDPYEESIIDTKLLDYSMVLQCSRSHYGFINDNEVFVDENKVYRKNIIPKEFNIFNNYFENSLKERIENIELINLLEATQFLRMLPFKCAAGDINKAKYFYVHACYLIEKILYGKHTN